jgi:hypothetical protein
MPSLEAVRRIQEQLTEAGQEAARFFAELEPGSDELSADRKARAEALSARFNAPLVRLVAMVQGSPMFGIVDVNAIQFALRRLGASLRLRRYREWESEALHDEGTVIGVVRAGSAEDERVQRNDAWEIMSEALAQALRRVAILRAQAEAEAEGQVMQAQPAAETPAMQVRPGTAFIMMMINAEMPELEDVKLQIQKEFARFNIRAVRSDEIEHSEETTQQILDAIRTSEFLIADLTGESVERRPLSAPSATQPVGFAAE